MVHDRPNRYSDATILKRLAKLHGWKRIIGLAEQPLPLLVLGRAPNSDGVVCSVRRRRGGGHLPSTSTQRCSSWDRSPDEVERPGSAIRSAASKRATFPGRTSKTAASRSRAAGIGRVRLETTSSGRAVQPHSRHSIAHGHCPTGSVERPRTALSTRGRAAMSGMANHVAGSSCRPTARSRGRQSRQSARPFIVHGRSNG